MVLQLNSYVSCPDRMLPWPQAIRNGHSNTKNCCFKLPQELMCYGATLKDHFRIIRIFPEENAMRSRWWSLQSTGTCSKAPSSHTHISRQPRARALAAPALLDSAHSVNFILRQSIARRHSVLCDVVWTHLPIRHEYILFISQHRLECASHHFL